MLSARALAAHLVSEDHPSRKICPYVRAQQTAERHNDTECQSALGQIHGQLTPRSSEPSSSPTSTQLKNAFHGSNLELSEKNKHLSTRTEILSGDPPRSRNKAIKAKDGQKAPKNKTKASQMAQRSSTKGIDSKSMTQNLFNTASMTLLQFTKIPQIWLSSASAHDEQPGMSKPRNYAKRNAMEDHKHASDVVIVGTRDIRNLTQLILNQHKTSIPRADNGCTVGDTLSVGGGAVALSDFKNALAPGREPTQFEYNTLRSHCEICQLKVDSKDSFHFAMPRRFIDQQCRPLSLGTKLQLIRQPIHSDVLTLAKAATAKRRDSCIELDSGVEFCKHKMMRQLGRTDTPIPLLHCNKEHEALHARVYPKYAQSISHTLSSSNILLRSYVSYKSHSYKSLAVWSDGFSDMVEGFCVLHERDFYPSNIFSSLWQSASSLSVSRPSRFKGTGNEEQLHDCLPATPRPKRMDTVGHTGAAHIAKLIFAALVAFVPEEDPHVWLAIQRLRASGHITVPGISEATLDIRNTIAKSLKIMDAFEDDMAHALLKKATSGLAARIHLPDSRILQTPRDEQKDSSPAPDVITLLIRGLIDPEAVAVILSAPNGTPTLGDGPLLRSVTSEIPSYQQVNGNTKIHLEILVEWLRGILLKEWDGNAEVPKCSALGGALELLDCICKRTG